LNMSVKPEEFELEKYLGTWHEQGSTPLWFSKDCKNSMADYSIVKEGVVRVINTCTKPDGLDSAEGRAFATDEPMRLKVGFFPKSFPIFRSDYKIRYLEKDEDGNYDKAIVTSGLDSVWILTRENDIGEEGFRRMLRIAEDMDIDISEVQRTRV